MRYRNLMLAAVFGFAVQQVAFAQQPSISNILDKSRGDLEKNLQTLDTYYNKVREKSGTGNAEATKPLAQEAAKPKAAVQKPVPQVIAQPTQPERKTRGTYERDPFAYTDRIKLNDPVFGGAGVSYSPKPITAQAALPRMTMKGFLSGGEEQSIGLLEIEGMGVQVVRKGDVVGLQQVGLDAVVRIIDMSSLGLIVETGSSGQAIVVR